MHIHWLDHKGVCRICKASTQDTQAPPKVVIEKPVWRACLSGISSRCKGKVRGTKENRICWECNQVLSMRGYL